MAKRFISFGVNEYLMPGNTLQGCLNDVETVTNRLVARSYSPFAVFKNNQATRDNVLKAIELMFAQAVAGDKLCIHNSSHGSQVDDLNGDESDGKDEVICTYDWPKYISDDDYYNLTLKLKKGVLVDFLSDSCHSETMERAIGQQPRCIPNCSKNHSTARPMWRETVKQKSFFTWLQSVFTFKACVGNSGILVLSGCKAGGTSADAWIDGKMQGAMTANWNYVLNLEPEQSYNQLLVNLRRQLKGTGFSQVPCLTGDATRFEQEAF